jgi:hypothetical protein
MPCFQKSAIHGRGGGHQTHLLPKTCGYPGRRWNQPRPSSPPILVNLRPITFHDQRGRPKGRGGLAFSLCFMLRWRLAVAEGQAVGVSGARLWMDVLARTAANGLSSQGPSSGPLLYQPDQLLLKCAKNNLRYRSQRFSSQKEFNGPEANPDRACATWIAARAALDRRTGNSARRQSEEGRPTV